MPATASPSRRQVATLALACLLPHAAQARGLFATTGSGPLLADHRDPGRFTGVRLSTNARVVIRPGAACAVDLTAEGNLLPLIETVIDDGVLVVRDTARFDSAGASVVITVRLLRSIRTSGSSDVSGDGLSMPLLSLALSGSSSLRLGGLTVGKLSVTLGGSSDLQLVGSAGQFVLNLGGSSNVKAARLAADVVTVGGGGSADVVLWARESLNVALGGSCSLRYYGVADARIATGGSSSVKRLGAAPPA